MTFTRITTSSSNDRDSWSPTSNADGTKIAFISDSDFLGQGILTDQNEIWLYDTTTVTVTRVTTGASADRRSHSPSLNADGTKIVFESNVDFFNQGIPQKGSEIWLYDTTTMTLTRVTTAKGDGLRESGSPKISADSTKIVFVSDSDFLDEGIADDQFEIWLYDVAAMTLTRITTVLDSHCPVYLPLISK
jgi:Tol biopolymer transport system component